MAGFLVVEVPLSHNESAAKDDSEIEKADEEGSLDELVERLNRGDYDAVEQMLKEYEPQIRLTVSRQLQGALRGKFDSMDVVQAVWTDVLTGFKESHWKFQDRRQLKAFLMTLARNRLIDKRRHFRKAIEKERPLGDMISREMPASAQPRPSQEVQGNELWEQMLEECPPHHRQLLLLRREGLHLSEIAKQTGLHEGSVRRILYDLARRVTRPRSTD